MKLTAMPNIGAEMERKLNAVGVSSAEDLAALGSKEAYLRMKVMFPEICLVHLYTLQAAIENTQYDMLSEEVKKDLKAYSDSLK